CHVAGVCDSATGVCSDPPVTDGTACDDGDLCTQMDTCQLGVCTGGGAVNCDDLNVCTTDNCDSAAGCINQRIIYDLDLNSAINLGDFSLFAPHFASVLGDLDYFVCADFYNDGAIDPADVSFFATAIFNACDSPSIVLPDSAHLPPATCPGSAAALTGPSFGSEPMDHVTVQVRAVILDAGSAAGEADDLPVAWPGPVSPGDTVVAEVWVRMFGLAPAGLTGGTINLAVDPSLVAMLDVAVDPNFSLFGIGRVDPTSGMAHGVGGATLDARVAVGHWVRFATAHLVAIGNGTSYVDLEQGPMSFAEYSVGLIPGNSVFTFDARIEVAGK
ncbi:MAG: hypothetical protein ACE5EX_09295, partial [Phycisphaerae bacterium]